MRINIIQHTPNERPGLIKTWAQVHQHAIYIYHPYQFDIFPRIEETDLLVILGGPMSVNDSLPWLKTERQLIKSALEAKIPILGICLGAQQIVKTLGGQITTAPVKEAGWAPVHLENQIIPTLPEKLTVLHWHGETFSLPPAAKLLFSSKLVKNQGFIYHGNVIGLQFHLELELENLREIVINDGNYLNSSIFKQSSQQVLNFDIPKQNKNIMFTLLDYLISRSF
ncbi:type 1 glutamine amidotransferase [Liquorilactobacillus sicerae]|uniref:type 1 glutamine amidotransferase n=1 Tax=Liquorilactobacillus sicerae TaxID=1416943 RepID=UPI0024804485|nr:type 1 glutamine amidotransferase [Liquorilactobacillus sicerae]